jgi:predicted nucleic acid-binding Zn ribbon protein
MADIRHCDQCGRPFEPRREHARFCSGACRVAWNREHRRDFVIELNSALGWSVAALVDLAPRLAVLASLAADDGGRAVAVVSEVVWQVTIVDATLVRYHPEVYDAVLARQRRRERRVTEGTMAGLRFVRNQLAGAAGLDVLIGPPPGGPAAEAGTWTWQQAPEPAAGVLRSQGGGWELSRYQAYQDFLASRAVTETLGRAAAFVRLAAARVQAVADVSAPAGR